MNDLVADIVAFYRLFGMFERDRVCCGTVSVPQCVVLQTLLSDTWDVTSLSQHMRVTKGATTRLVDGLEARELVKRTQDESDGRRHIISLTRAGRKEATRLAAMTEQAIATIMEAIPACDREQVARSVRQLRSAVEEVRDALDCC